MASFARRVTLQAQHRTITLDPGPVPADPAGRGQATVSYAGLLLTRLGGRAGHLDEARLWLPMGEEPSFADDEMLIDALHQAVCWVLDRRSASTARDGRSTEDGGRPGSDIPSPPRR